MTQPTIILLGAARSGTKFLRDCLGAGSGTAIVPHDVNYIWRYGNESAPHDRLDPDSLTPKRIAFIREALVSVAKATPDDRLIEKSVSNTLRVPFVDRVFPDAVYVHLLRDGRDVTESAMRQWQAPPDWKALIAKLRGLPLRNVGYVFWFAANFVKGLLRGRKGGGVWGPRFEGIGTLIDKATLAEVCAAQWVASVEATRAALSALPSDRVHTVRYEDLIAGETAIAELADALGLPDRDGVISAWRKKVRAGEPAQWRSLPQTDQDTISHVAGPTLIAVGYIQND